MAHIGEDKVPEEALCPVCVQLLDKDIFQCQNGHIVCEDCIKTLSTCPQCREPFGTPPMRNRALENILDRMKFDCKYKVKGCIEQQQRVDVKAHQQSCKFRGTDISICKIFGSCCEEKLNSYDLDHITQHLTLSHKLRSKKLVDKQNVQIIFKNCEASSYALKSFWGPVLLEDSTRKVLVSFALSAVNYCLQIETVVINVSQSNRLGSPVRTAFQIQISWPKFQHINWEQEALSLEKCGVWRQSTCISIDLQPKTRTLFGKDIFLFFRFPSEGHPKISIAPDEVLYLTTTFNNDGLKLWGSDSPFAKHAKSEFSFTKEFKPQTFLGAKLDGRNLSSVPQRSAVDVAETPPAYVKPKDEKEKDLLAARSGENLLQALSIGTADKKTLPEAPKKSTNLFGP